MNRRNILLYTLAGIFAILGALANGISPFIVGIPAAEKAVSLGEALIQNDQINITRLSDFARSAARRRRTDRLQ